MSAPFKIKHGCIIVEGGYLKELWVIEPKVIDGEAFLVMSKGDRKLARAMGLNMEEQHPWKGTNILNQLIDTRDLCVYNLLCKKLNDDDEMAEGDAHVKIPKSGRAKLYQKAGVPSVIQISVPKFQVDGGMHPAVTLNVLSTVAKGSSVAIELTTDNLEFLRAAAHSKELQVQRLKRKCAEPDLPELMAPIAYWRRRGAAKPTIM